MPFMCFAIDVPHVPQPIVTADPPPVSSSTFAAAVAAALAFPHVPQPIVTADPPPVSSATLADGVAAPAAPVPTTASTASETSHHQSSNTFPRTINVWGPGYERMRVQSVRRGRCVCGRVAEWRFRMTDPPSRLGYSQQPEDPDTEEEISQFSEYDDAESIPDYERRMSLGPVSEVVLEPLKPEPTEQPSKKAKHSHHGSPGESGTGPGEKRGELVESDTGNKPVEMQPEHEKKTYQYPHARDVDDSSDVESPSPFEDPCPSTEDEMRQMNYSPCELSEPPTPTTPVSSHDDEDAHCEKAEAEAHFDKNK